MTIPSDNKKTKTLFVGVVTTSFPLVEGSSSGIFIERLIKNMPSQIKVTVLVPCPNFKIKCRNGSYKIKCFSYGHYRWQRLAHYPGGIPNALKSRDPALILLPAFISTMFVACLRMAGKVDLLHGNWSIPGLIAGISSRLRGRHSIVTLRGEDVNRARNSRIFRLMLKACMFMNQYIVTVSEAMRDELSELYPSYSNRIMFISNGVDNFTSEIRPTFMAPLRLLTIGSCIRRKRIDVILNAIALLDPKDSVLLRVAGDGPEVDSLKGMAQNLKIDNYVEFVGLVPPEEVKNLLSWADIFVFASESEGRPNVILEAMSAGLTVISSDIDGVRELIAPEAGMLYPVGDKYKLSQCIQDCLQKPMHAKNLGVMAKRKIESSGLTWEKAANKYSILYNKVIFEKNR